MIAASVLGLHDVGAPWHKVPLLLSLVWFTLKSTTPPNPPPKDVEQTRYVAETGAKDFTASRFWTPKPFQITTCGLLVGEAALIAASALELLPSPRLYALLPSSPDITVQDLHPSPLFYAGWALVCAGTSLRLVCFRRLGRSFAFVPSVQDAHRLTTDGPYAIVRHPGYLGSTLYYTGICLSLLSRGSWAVQSGLWETRAGWAFAAVYVGYSLFIVRSLLRRMATEDKVLRDEFGEEWRKWAMRTPYRLIPFIY